MPKKPKIIVIVGPNASGKSELGIKLAKKLNGEIISADSRQVYKGLDVGSGKITRKEMRGVRHHCLSVANPKKVFTADDYRKCAQKAITMIYHSNKTPIIVGGTGFYIDAALGRTKLAEIPPNPKLRKKLSNYSTTQLFNYLTKLDPKRAKTIEQKNPRRLIRAIEIALGKADAISELILASPARGSEASAILLRQKSETMPKWPQKPFGNSSAFPKNTAAAALESGFGARNKRPLAQVLQDLAQRDGASRAIRQQANMRVLAKPGAKAVKIIWIGIKRPPEELKKRIRARLLKRLPSIIREVKKLHSNGLSWKRLYDFGLEYRYTSLYLRGKISNLQLIQQLTSQIWRYAKRQMTYFKKNKEIRWISP